MPRTRLPWVAALAFASALVPAAAVLAAPPDAAPLRVGLTGKYPPFNYFDADGALAGFDVDFARAICAELGRPCDFVVLQWDGIVSALLAGKVDAIIGSMAITEERARQVAFSVPYYSSGAQLFAAHPDAVPPDLAGVRVGVTLGTTYGDYAREHFPKADVRFYKGDTEALQDLQAGRLDALLTDRLVGFYMKRRFEVAMEPSGGLLYRERMGIPVDPDDHALLAAIDRAITRFRASPAEGELYARYFGEGALVAAGTDYTWSHMLGVLALALLDTLRLAAVGLALGILLAALIAAGLIGLPRPFALLLSLWVDFIRATPFIVQLFILYFGLPAVGVELSAWTAAMIGIALHSSAYVSEILKVAFRGVPISQTHAARTLGLTRVETLRHVVIPQMLPLVSVPVINTMVAMIKDSAIVSVISVYELTMATQQLISATFEPMSLYLVAAAMYFAVTYPLLLAGRRLERRYQRRGLLHGG